MPADLGCRYEFFDPVSFPSLWIRRTCCLEITPQRPRLCTLGPGRLDPWSAGFGVIASERSWLCLPD